MAVKIVKKPKIRKTRVTTSTKSSRPSCGHNSSGPSFHKRVRLAEEKKSTKRTLKANPRKFPPEPPIDDED